MAIYASLKDVAATAGVSFQTASKVLKGKGNVSPATRSRIWAAAETLEYVPNALARYVASCRTHAQTQSPTRGQSISRAGLRPTVREVAAVAGVSVKSVSRVINAEPRVSEELRSRVQAAIEQLDFRHNVHASLLRRGDGKSATIGLVLGNVVTPFSSSLHRVIQNEALHRGVLVFAGSTDDDAERERDLMAAFSSHRVDGLIITATSQDHRTLLRESRAGTAMVFVDCVASVPEADCVTTDCFDGVRRGMRHLIAHGHRRIGYLGGPASTETKTRRYKAYEVELKAQGLPIDSQLVRLGLSDVGASYAVAVQLLSLNGRPTALFASHNVATVGAYRATRALRLTDQVAVVGYDDVLLADLQVADITVVARDPEAIGRSAASLLFRRIAGDSTSPVCETVTAQLILRGSGEISC